MKETYVTFKTAKLLKEKGFDWECLARYDKPILSNNVSIFTEANAIDWNTYYYGSDYKFSAPTQQMACRWLMEEKHIFIGKSFAKNKETLNLEFYSPVFNMDTGELITTIGAFCPEDAIEGALQYVLTNLI